MTATETAAIAVLYYRTAAGEVLVTSTSTGIRASTGPGGRDGTRPPGPAE
ncbi:MAG: hypothetical protein ACM32E_21295 [Gemmatimonadota bacterium]